MVKVNVIGIGPGNPELLTEQAKQAITKATILIGDKRTFALLDTASKKLFSTIKTDEIKEIIANADENNDIIGILATGDVGFFSLAKTMTKVLTDCQLELVPGISSLVYFAAKLKMSWDDAKIVSMHGRNQNLIQAILENKKVFSLTGGENTVQALCEKLSKQGLGEVQVFVGENLSYDNEVIDFGTADEIAKKEFSSLAVMMIINGNTRNTSQVVHGLPDESFLRGKAPMTKQEVRSISISKLAPGRNDVIYDIGAGTGSCSIELALQAPQGKVYAFEKAEDALELLALNKERFNVTNLEIIAGDAAVEVDEMPAADSVFIGGSGGNMHIILDKIYTKNPVCKVVMNAITLETVAEVVEYYKKREDFELDIINVSIAANKIVGRYNMMMGQNPIYIMTAFKKEA